MKISAFFLAFPVAAGVGLGQDPPRTGTMRSGGVSLSRIDTKFSAGPFGSIGSTTDSVGAVFQSTDFSKFIPTQPLAVTTVGPCVVSTPTPQIIPPDNSGAITALDAGPVLNVTWPSGSTQFTATRFSFGGLLGGGLSLPGQPPAPPLVLDPETVTVDNGAGGADVPAWVASITIPGPAFVWTNADANLSIDRTKGVDFTWAGGDPSSKVAIYGGVYLYDPATHQLSSETVFACTADNSADHLFVAPDVLGLLPATVGAKGMSNGILTVVNRITATFEAPGIDLSHHQFLRTLFAEFRTSVSSGRVCPACGMIPIRANGPACWTSSSKRPAWRSNGTGWR